MPSCEGIAGGLNNFARISCPLDSTNMAEGEV